MVRAIIRIASIEIKRLYGNYDSVKQNVVGIMKLMVCSISIASPSSTLRTAYSLLPL